MTQPDKLTVEETAPQLLQRLGMDGKLWAEEFHKTAIKLGYSDMDEGWLIGWFCNAVMAGYDEAQRRSADTMRENERKDKALLLAARWFKLNFDDDTLNDHPPSKADLAGMFDAMQEARQPNSYKDSAE